jgi:hypothetical protein
MRGNPSTVSYRPAKLLAIEEEQLLPKGNALAKVPLREADEVGERRAFHKVNRTLSLLK